MSGWSEYCSIQGTKRKLKSGFTGESKKPGKKDQELLTSSGRSFLKSNCVRPPHPKGWGMLMGRTPGFLGIVKYPLTRFSLSLIHISEPTRLLSISYAVFCLKKKKKKTIK